MADFAGDGSDLLVATTVIEVGVDVPQATIMVVEHAERFGLAQLHQLRGRIGRGSEASTCLLLYQAPLGEIARERISILRETEDGFRIAEEDLRLRGGGEVLGTQAERPAGAAPRRPRRARAADRNRPRRRAAGAVARPETHDAARRGAAHAALSVPARRGGAVHPGRMTQSGTMRAIRPQFPLRGGETAGSARCAHGFRDVHAPATGRCSADRRAPPLR